MSKSRPNAHERETSRGQRDASRPGTFIRVVVSLLVVWHLAAVFLAPLSVHPTSQFVVGITQQRPMQWYLDLLYLNHGYHFFAPDPGPGHLIRYELFDGRGALLKQGEFPNKDVQWPRLWYHRHFMLADQAGLPQESEQETAAWQRKYLESYARRLLRENEEAEMVRLRRIAHHPLPPQLALEGRKLNDPAGYETLMEVIQRRSDLRPATTEQRAIWQGTAPYVGGRPTGAGRTGGVR